MRFKKIIFPFILLFTSKICGQKESPEVFFVISEILEQSQLTNPNDTEFNTAFDDLIFYYNNKLNLNNATEDELKTLVFLSQNEIDAILNYRKWLSEYVEIDELKLAGLNALTIEKLKLFLTLKPNPEWSAMSVKKLKNGRHEFYSRFFRVLENQAGYKKENGFLGNPNKLYLRYNYNLENRLKAGFVLEKDAGEQFFSTNSMTNKNDFTGYRNAFVSYKGKSKVKSLIVGSYSLRLGQGLMAWNGFSLGKSALLNLNKKSSNEISAYSSANEVNFLRGISTQIALKKLLITPYISYKKIDANLEQDSTGAFISSIPILGFHRTQLELDKRKTNREFISGMSLSRSFKELHLGTSYQFLNYSNRIKKGEKRYQTDNFEGKNLHSISFNYSYRKKKLTLFGEYAVQSKLKTALLSGFILRPYPGLTLQFIYRDYDAGYFTPYNAGFGEKSRTNNEKGTYFSVEKSLGLKTKLKIYTDRYHRETASYESIKPYSGTEFFTQLERQENRSFMHYMRFSRETNNASRTLNEKARTIMLRGRYHLETSPNYRLSLRSRVELNHINREDWGQLFYQDIKYYWPKPKISLTARYARFNTPNFNQAIYAYENDVLFFFNTPAYFNKGTRVYGMINWKATKNFTLWIRASRWIYDKQKDISSGNTMISGNKKTDIHIQTILTF